VSALRRMVHEVHAIEIGTNTRYEQHQLVVGQEQALALFADPALASVRLHVAAPGDRVRIVAPLDVVEPRSKGPGGGVFPGWMAPVNRPRGGDTHVLRGAAVLAAGHLPRNQEGLIDMSGPAADRSPFARTNNVVIEFDRACCVWLCTSPMPPWRPRPTSWRSWRHRTIRARPPAGCPASA